MRNFSELPALNTSSQNWSSFDSVPREGRQLPSRSTEAHKVPLILQDSCYLPGERTHNLPTKQEMNKRKALLEAWILSGHLQDGAKRSYDHKYSPLFRPASCMYNPEKSIYS